MKGRYWLIGFSIGLSIILFVIFESTKGKGMGAFLDLPGILLVFGGSIATAFIAWPPGEVLNNLKVISFVLRKRVEPSGVIVTEIVNLVKDSDCDVRELEKLKPRIKNFFLKDGVELIVDRLEPHHIEAIMKERIKQNKTDYDAVTQLIKTLAKYPPAFGMIGTLCGLVAIMRGLGSSVGASNLGPAMAVGLVATFYGVAFANLMLLPMSDNVAYKSNRELLNRQIVLKGISLILQNESAIVVQESLNSMLKFTERVDALGIGGAATQAKAKGKGRAA